MDWEKNDIKTLINNVEAHLNKKDQNKPHASISRLDWNKIAWSTHTPEDCKEKFTEIVDKKMRTYRTLAEIIIDAKQFADNPYLTFGVGHKEDRPAGYPKKPLTPFFRFFQEKRVEITEKNKALGVTEISRLAAKQFKELSQKKKDKYKKAYERDMIKYGEDMDQWNAENPEYALQKLSQKKQKGQEGPPKPRTPLAFYTEKELKGQAPTKELIDAIKEKWADLSDGKRIKYIRKAVDDEQRYQGELENYKKSSPGFESTFKTVLTKSEKALKDRFEGKPVKPAGTGYQLYSRKMLSSIQNVDSKSKMSMIAQRWRELSPSKQEEFNADARQQAAQFAERVTKYLDKLPEEEREAARKELLGDSNKTRKLTKTQKEKAAGVPIDRLLDNQEITQKALELYQTERLSELEKQNKPVASAVSDIFREWQNATSTDKEPFLRKAQEVLGIFKFNSPRKAGNKVKLLLREELMKKLPKLPPRGGWAMFSTEKLTQLKHIDAKNRMTEAAKLWSQTSDKDKKKYEDKAQKALVDFGKEVTKFEKLLNPDELILFRAWLSGKVKSNEGKKPKKAAASKASKVPSTPKAQASAPVVNEAGDDGSEESEEEEDSDEDEESDDDAPPPPKKSATSSAKKQPPTPAKADESNDESSDSGSDDD